MLFGSCFFVPYFSLSETRAAYDIVLVILLWLFLSRLGVCMFIDFP
jgi:hypothetical protein